MDAVLCVGIDLDDLRYYRAIHALPDVPDTPVLFEAALPRFLQLCAKVGVRATLFAIASDLRWPVAVAALKGAVAAGHEVASHSHAHRYDLSLMPEAAMESDVMLARRALSDAIGRPVVGFRGPGYNLSDDLLHALVRAGYQYDSTCLASPPYFLARAAIIGAMRIKGARSASIVGRGRDFFRGTRPFMWETVSLPEYPITGCGLVRIPLIGTTLASRSWRRRLVSAASRLDFLNIEFHGIDFLDLEKDGLDPALAVEPALRVPLAERLVGFEEALLTLAAGRKNCPLAELGQGNCCSDMGSQGGKDG